MQYDELMRLSYQEFLDEVLRDSPKDCTWMDVRDWVETQYMPQQIATMYCKLYKQLIIFTPDDDEESSEADLLRAQMDIFWYAAPVEEIDKILQPMLEEKNML
jgi:hypothetical protein